MGSRVAALCVMASIAMACSGTGSPVAPGLPVVLANVRVVGPASVVPGQTVHYTAMADYSDGSSRDVTLSAKWSPPVGSPLSFSSPGIAVANANGETVVRATYSPAPPDFQRSGELSVLILEPGTFKLSGKLTGLGGEPVSGEVQVIAGNGAGQFGYGVGEYRVYGVSGPIRLRALADYYVVLERDVVVNGNSVSDLALAPTDPPVAVNGTWAITLAPSPNCPPGLPEIAQNRNYDVTITQHGIRLEFSIASPTTHVEEPGILTGSVFGPRLSLDIGDVLDDFTGQVHPNVVDRLSDTESFSFYGDINATVQGMQTTASFDGGLRYWKGSLNAEPTWQCRATDHQVTMTRR